MNLVKTSLGSTYNRGDFTDGNAFLWSSLDLSPNAGLDSRFTPFYIELLDAAGKKATGYIGAVGAGETLEDELLTNPSFDIDTTGWSSSAASLASIAGGQSGNCLEVTRVGDDFNGAYQPPPGSLIFNSLCKLAGYVKSGTSGDENYSITISDNSPIPYSNGTSSGSWVQCPPYYRGIVSGEDRYIRVYKESSTEGTMLFDEVSLKRVVDPPSTAVHIVSSLNGTIRNWASIESGFNPNTIASWDIYQNFLPSTLYIIEVRHRRRR